MDTQNFLNGSFLAAMPQMEDERFSRAVIYICNHSTAGAMGFVLNRPHEHNFLDLLMQLDLVEHSTAQNVPESVLKQPLRYGGPVEQARGFVLHSDDYMGAATTKVAAGVCLTSTLDILRLIYTDSGPNHALVVLGFAGWGSGQLEAEIAANGWLTAPATPQMIFEGDISTLYERVVASIGVDLSRFVSEAGHS